MLAELKLSWIIEYSATPSWIIVSIIYWDCMFWILFLHGFFWSKFTSKHLIQLLTSNKHRTIHSNLQNKNIQLIAFVWHRQLKVKETKTWTSIYKTEWRSRNIPETGVDVQGASKDLELKVFEV